MRELIERCAGRIALVENRDGLPPQSEAGPFWAARLQRGQELLRATLPSDHATHPVQEVALAGDALRAMPAASAMSAVSALQGAVGGSAASDVTDEALGAAFNGRSVSNSSDSGGDEHRDSGGNEHRKDGTAEGLNGMQRHATVCNGSNGSQ